MISKAFNCIFIHIPRTGGHTIDRLFLDNGLVSEELWHYTAHDLITLIGWDKFCSYYSFSIVRNPWERWLSEWAWQTSINYATQIPTPWGNKNISFEEFCRSSHEWYPDVERANGHLGNQSDFIFDANDQLLVHTLFRFENLPWKFAPKRNSTHHGEYRSYYSDATAELIGKRFERDVKLLGYSF